MDAKYEGMTVEQVEKTLTDVMRVRLAHAYAERLDGDTGPMSTEAWYLCTDESVNMALQRRGLTKIEVIKRPGFFDEEWRLLSDFGVEVAAYVVEKYEITWGPKR